MRAYLCVDFPCDRHREMNEFPTQFTPDILFRDDPDSELKLAECIQILDSVENKPSVDDLVGEANIRYRIVDHIVTAQEQYAIIPVDTFEDRKVVAKIISELRELGWDAKRHIVDEQRFIAIDDGSDVLTYRINGYDENNTTQAPIARLGKPTRRV